MAMIRYNPYESGDYFWFITSPSTLPILYKYFIIIGLEHKIRLADLILLITIINDTQMLIMFKD
jgi:hypothetical protein